MKKLALGLTCFWFFLAHDIHNARAQEYINPDARPRSASNLVVGQSITWNGSTPIGTQTNIAVTKTPCVDGTSAGNICPGDYNGTQDGATWIDGSVALGYQALANAKADGFNTAVGDHALQSMDGIDGIYAFNFYAQVGNGGMNTAIGEWAMGNSTAKGCNSKTAGASLNTAFGFTTLMNVQCTSGTGGYSNTALGEADMLRIINGYYNTGVGNDFMSQNGAGGGAHDNTGVGAELCPLCSGNYNTLYGSHAGNVSGGLSGSDNLELGPYVGTTTLTTGSSNILIGVGNWVDTPTNNTSSRLNIGNLIQGDMTNVSTSAGQSGNTTSFFVQSTASGVDYLQAAGGASGNPGSATLSAQGSDSNVNIVVTPKGTGLTKFGNAASFSANGAVATSLGSVGPTGSHTTVQEWLTVIDSGGNTRYIPAF